MPQPDWQRLLTADLDAAALGAAMARLRWTALAAAVALPALLWPLDWRLLCLWFAELLVLLALLPDATARRSWRHPLLLPTVVYAVMIAVAALAADYPVLAWHGAFDRQEGAFTLFGYLALAALPPLALTGWVQARRLLDALLALGVLQAALALLQYLGALPAWATARLPDWYWQSRLAEGLFNSPSLAASYFALALVAAALLYVAGGTLWYLPASALLTAGLLATETRGAWLTAPIALVVGLLLLRYRARLPWPGRRLGALVLLCLLAAALLAVASPGLRRRLMALPPSFSDALHKARAATPAPGASAAPAATPAPGAPAAPAAPPLNPSDAETNSLVQRLVIWRVGLQAVMARPWLGWGPDSFEVAWNALRDRSTLFIFGLLARIDKAHSDLLQVTVTTGMAGLAAYLWLLVAAARLAWRGAVAPGAEGVGRMAAAAGALAYFLSVQTTITHVSSAPAFWLLLGLLAVQPTTH